MVVAGVSVVDVVADPEDDEAVELGVVVAEVALVVVELVAVDDDAAVAVERSAACDVCADARPAKRATPATDPAASQPVASLVRRRRASRRAGEVMGPLGATRLGGV